jgi:hypothetical protein
MKRYQRIAQVYAHLSSLDDSADRFNWSPDHLEDIKGRVADQLAKLLEYAPSGGGFDSGTELDDDLSSADRLVFTTSFHHMDDHGSYCGWSDHSVIVNPCLADGFSLQVTGRNKRDIKNYISELFHEWLNGEAEDVPLDLRKPEAA